MLEKFERFLESIPLEDCREKLASVKTVEQGLRIGGHDLNPLQRNLKNGFVVFREDYPKKVKKALPALIKSVETDLIRWQTAMKVIWLPK